MRIRRPLGGVLGPGLGDIGQSLAALALSVVASLVAGLSLAAFESDLATFPGLLLFVPPAIGLRGNVFGPLGGRLSTSIQTGTFAWSWRPESLLGQNLVASMMASMLAALVLAGFAEVVVLFVLDTANPIGLADFIVVSVLGGALASIVVVLITMALTVGSVRFGWDLDNVTAPMVTAAGDIVTLPTLVFAARFIDRGALTTTMAWIAAVACLASLAPLVVRSMSTARRIVGETLPVLCAAGLLSLLAGVAVEQNKADFLTFTVLLVLLPGYLTTAGALGGILSNRLGTKFHLGLIDAGRRPRGAALDDMRSTLVLAVPIFLLLGVVVGLAASWGDHSTPGFGVLIAVVMTAGLVSTAVVTLVAYYGTLLAVRFGLDPDNHGIPIVTATIDVVGAVTLVGALILWGVA